MSTFTGPQYRGAMRDHRKARREKAQKRQTLHQRRQEAAQIVDQHLAEKGEAS